MAKPAPAPPSMFLPGTLYTVRIATHNETEDGKKGIFFQNIPAETVERMKNEIYQKGIAYCMKATGTVELIAPFNIVTVLIMPQK